MVSYPKIETLWIPKGPSQQHPPSSPGPPPSARRNNDDAAATDDATSIPPSTTASTHHQHPTNQNRLHLPRLRNLLSALNFEHNNNDTTAELEAVPRSPPQSNSKATTTTVDNNTQREPPSKDSKINKNTAGSSGNRFFQSTSRVLRGSMIDSDLNGKSTDGSDIFYDALQYGNSPNNKDAFLPDSESPRESIVLAGVVVTSALHSPSRVDHGGRHPNIETVLQSKNDPYSNSHKNHDQDYNSTDHHLHKSVEYTEHEYEHRISSTVADGDTSDTGTTAPHPSTATTGMSQYPPASPPAPDELPVRFLRAGKNDPVEGIRRYEATLQMRREQKIDTILREPSEKFHIIKQHYPHYCHYRGKNNEPCFYEQPPKTNLSELRKNGVTLDKLLHHYTMVTEYQWQYIERDDLARSIYIIDLNGIRMTDFVGEAVDFVKKASAFSAQHYPERAGYVFVINVPGWFKLIWNVVKPIIDEDTLKKIYILRGKEEIRTAMQERIPLEHIPPEYGGTSLPLGQSPQEQTLAEWMEHNNTLAEQQRTVCHNYLHCQFCTWTPARSY